MVGVGAGDTDQLLTYGVIGTPAMTVRPMTSEMAKSHVGGFTHQGESSFW